MDENLIAIETLCTVHNIEVAFITSLQQSGLIEVTTIQQKHFITIEHLPQVEKYIRFHYDFDINLEGIETIAHLLGRLENIQGEVSSLRKRLHLYE